MPLILQSLFDTDLTSARARYQEAFGKAAEAKRGGDTRKIHETQKVLRAAKTELLRAELGR